MKKKFNKLNQQTLDIFQPLEEWPEGYHNYIPEHTKLQGNVSGMDIETEGLNPYDKNARIISVGISPKEKVAYSLYLIKPEHSITKYGNEIQFGYSFDNFVKLVNDPNAILVGHNIKYDANWIATKLGISIKCMLFDTMFAQYLIDENIESNSLEYLTEIYPDLKGYKQKVNRNDLARISKDDELLYNCRDADGSRRLYDFFIPKLRDGGYLNLMTTASMVLPILSKMETRGVYLDVNWANKTKDKLFKELVSLRYTMSDIAKTNVDPDSPQKLGTVLYGRLGFVPTAFTNTGQPSTSSESLGYLVDQANTEDKNRFLDSILTYKKKVKLITTYYQPINKWIEYDGRVHTNYSLGKQSNDEATGGTVTGRLSSNKPNLQNIPRGKEHRGMFAATEGFQLLDGDFCVSPETKILKSDLTWVSAKDLITDDELIGFDELANGRDRTFQPSKVLGIKLIKQPCYEIVTSKGTVISSGKHRWLAREWRGLYNGTRQYIATEDLKVFDDICFYHEPWEADESKEAYYLRGFFDGEGWLSGHMVGFGQNDGDTYRYVSQLLKDKGFDFTVNKKNGRKVIQERITQSANTAAFIGSIRPPRLLKKSKDIWLDKSNWGKRTQPATIKSIKFIGEQEVIGIETETKTYIANGFLSHNSQLELRVAAFLSQEPVMMDAFNNGLDIHSAVMSDLTGMPYDEIQSGKDVDEKIKNDRVAIKRVNFGILYGVQAKRLQRLLRIELGIQQELEYCREIIRKWLNRYERVSQWIDSQKIQAATYKYVTMPLGQRRRLPDASFEKSKEAAHALAQATNFPVQSLASWICLIGLIILDNYWEQQKQWMEAYTLMQVHDSVTSEIHLIKSPYSDELNNSSEVKPKVLDNLLTMDSIKIEVSKIMEKETVNYLREVFGVNFNVPLVFETKISERWS